MGAKKWIAVCLFVASAAIVGRSLPAFSDGIAGYTGDPVTGSIDCNACHEGGQPPAVMLNGPTEVDPGTTHTYELRLTQPFPPNNDGGGLGVSASAGTLSAIEAGTQLLDFEIAHTAPRNSVGGAVAWTFDWTAPLTPGPVTLYGAGNAVNLAQGLNGDRASTTTLQINVAGTSTPGETSGPGLSPLLVTAFDAVTEELSLSFDTGCDTTSNNLYFGPLDQVSSHGWTGEICDIGTGGALGGFDPGLGSFFFVVVGTKDDVEGSYGEKTEGGVPAERPPFAGSTCGQMQDLTTSCD